MPRPTSAADATPVRVVIVTLDGHLASAVERAQLRLRRELPGISLKLHALAEWSGNPGAQETWTGTLLPDSSADYTFVTTFTSPVGNYILCAGTSIIGDGNAANDEFCDNIVGTGVTDADGNEWNLMVFPNPSRDEVTLAFDLASADEVLVRIYGIRGDLIRSMAIPGHAGHNELRLNLGHLGAGTYLLSLGTAQGVARTRVSIVK